MNAEPSADLPDLHAAAAALNAAAPGLDVEARLRLACDAAAGRLCLTTSFGIEDQLLTAAASRLGGRIEVATLDTGRLFPETHEVWRETERRYGLIIRACAPEPAAVSALVARDGLDGFYDSVAKRRACCGVRKTEPLSRLLYDAAGWVTGLRGEQSSERSEVPFAAADEERGLLKVSPLYDWTRQAVLDALTAGDVPVSRLEARGYRSVGCEPCTRAVRPHEPERAGRWWWENGAAKECGLHTPARAA